MSTILSYRQLINGVVALTFYLLAGYGPVAPSPMVAKPIDQDLPWPLHCRLLRGTKLCDLIKMSTKPPYYRNYLLTILKI